MKLSTILSQIDIGSIALPVFQRGYVWNRNQVRAFMDSLYRKHPVGSLLVWITKSEDADIKGNGVIPHSPVKLLLDGQQRITSLYGIINGTAPKFFEGNEKIFKDLYFNIQDEVFEFYGPLKMRGNPFWVSVTDLMKNGLGRAIQIANENPKLKENIDVYINRLSNLYSILETHFHVEEVTGEEKTVDIVVDIFNRVNSGGTKLSKGDLALAKICAEWPDARDEMKKCLDKWSNAGFNFKMEWLLRCVNTITTGEALFSALKDIDIDTIRDGLEKAEKYIDSLLNLISARLGLDHDRVLGSRYSFPLMVRYLSDRDGRISDHLERDKLLYWFIHTMLWGRYAGSTETYLNQDLEAIEERSDSLDKLIDLLRQSRGGLKLNANDFIGWSRGARFYPLLYMLTRVYHARDLETGIELSAHLLGSLSSLQVHHLFPKSLLYKKGYDKSEVNALANFTFLTQETNLSVSNRDPIEYFEIYEKKNPSVLESHWIPMDSELWQVDRYLDFLDARRQLLADAGNEFLNSLYAGSIPEVESVVSIEDRVVTKVPGGIEDQEEEQLLLECNIWVIDQGLSEGEFLYELVDELSGTPLAVLDLAWPDGIQEGLSQPVALLIDESPKVEQITNNAGYLYFTSVNNFKTYVKREILDFDDTTYD